MGKTRLWFNGGKDGMHFPKLHTVCKCEECMDNDLEDGEVWPDQEEFDGHNHGEGSYIKPENGVYLMKWSTGHKRYEWEYNNGNRADGVAKGWYPNGKPKQFSTWKNGQLNGLRTYWHPNGHKERDENLVKDMMEGECIWYHVENGNPKIIGNYHLGIPDGLWVWYTHMACLDVENYSDKKICEGSYKDGKKDGIWKTWIPNYHEYPHGWDPNRDDRLIAEVIYEHGEIVN